MAEMGHATPTPVEERMFRRSTILAFAVLVAAACGDANAPAGDFDAVLTQEAADTVIGSVDQNVALQSMAVLAQAFALTAGQQAAVQAALVAVPTKVAGQSRSSVERVQAFGAAAVAFSSAAPADLFPPSVQGNTYVLNPQTLQYEVDPTATGAPATGVRFVLYAVDPILSQVVTPLQEIGWVDLIDESTATANSLHIVAVVGEVTALDYIASAQLGGGGATFTVDGTISDGTESVDFDLSFGVTNSSVTVDYLISVVGRNQSIRLEAAGSADQASLTITLTVVNGAETARLTATISAGQIEGSITHNGTVVVTFSGNEDNPTFVGADGAALTEREIRALHDLGELIDEMFDSLEDLLEPAEFVFGV